jgi:hypothetical protein
MKKNCDRHSSHDLHPSKASTGIAKEPNKEDYQVATTPPLHPPRIVHSDIPKEVLILCIKKLNIKFK